MHAKTVSVCSTLNRISGYSRVTKMDTVARTLSIWRMCPLPIKPTGAHIIVVR